MVLAWPCRFFKALSGSSEAREAIEDFRQAWEVEKYWRCQAPSRPIVKQFLQRSTFMLTPVMQLVHALEHEGWQYTNDISKLIEDWARGVGGWNIREHVNNAMGKQRQAGEG